jgi:hypothetical protein
VKRALLAAVAAALAAGCGKMGPPLPPLVKLPVAPTDLAAARRGDTVDLTVTVPAANTDGTRPANISRVDIYALTAPVSTSDTIVLKDGARVASVQVKAPRDPNDTVDVDDPSTDVDPPEGPGLDQGAAARLSEALTAAAERPWRPPVAKNTKSKTVPRDVPLVGAPLTPPVRLYLALGVNKRGRQGPVSKRVNVPLMPAPARGPEPLVAYDESSITVSWSEAPPSADDSAPVDVLPSRPLAAMSVSSAYNVYEVMAGAAGGDVKRTATPISDTSFVDHRIEWGQERCYAVRRVREVGSLTIEGERGPSRCVTPVDTFPPAVPNRPTAIGVAGAINILWDANAEPDLAGYLVSRGTAAGGPTTRLTPEPIDRTNFTDEVPAGFRAFYAVQAVDKAGNVSAMSPVSDEETAR